MSGGKGYQYKYVDYDVLDFRNAFRRYESGAGGRQFTAVRDNVRYDFCFDECAERLVGGEVNLLEIESFDKIVGLMEGYGLVSKVEIRQNKEERPFAANVTALQVSQLFGSIKMDSTTGLGNPFN